MLSSFDTAFCRSRSAIVTAVMDSTTTTARGTMTGSCLPWMEISISSPDSFTVCCVFAIEEVGFTAARRISLAPSLIPPSVPPEWFVSLHTFPSFMRKGSLFLLPTEEAAENPSPISTPFIAPMEHPAYRIQVPRSRQEDHLPHTQRYRRRNPSLPSERKHIPRLFQQLYCWAYRNCFP